MRFESPDHPPEYPDMPADEIDTASYDAADVSDLLPTSVSPDLAECPEQPLNRPFRFEQVQLVDGEIVMGFHPDGRVQAGINQYAEGAASRHKAIEGFYASSPEVREADGGIFDGVRARLNEDFGSAVARKPILVMSERGYRDYARIAGLPGEYKPLGYHADGRLVVVERHPEVATELGDSWQVNVALHEGAHGARDESTNILATRPLRAGDRDISIVEWRIGQRVRMERVGGFIQLDPTLSSGTFGSYWEEAFAEHYAVQTKADFGFQVTFDSTSRRHGSRALREGIIFTGDSKRPFYDREQHAFCLPWKFAAYVLPPNEKRDLPKPYLGHETLSALTIGILDRHLPGLFEEMKQSRADPAVLPHIQGRINGISPGLYDSLARVEATSISDTELNHIRILKALKIVDEPIGEGW